MSIASQSLVTSVTLPWFALKVRSGSEPIAKQALDNRGYDSFYPTISERKRYCDRMKTVESVAFPGYIFCRLDLRKKTTILSSPAVQSIVGCGHAPSPIPDEEIEQIRRALDAGGRPAAYARAGQRVKIEFGSLAGLEGVLINDQHGKRLVVSIELLQRSVAVQIDESQTRIV
jgi:transcription antitermination factor NusG